jgi:hypothetical protein
MHDAAPETLQPSRPGRHDPVLPPPLPRFVAEQIRVFLDHGRTGNLILYVKNGRVLEGHSEDIWQR